MKIKSEGLIWLFSALAVVVFRVLFMTLRTEFHLSDETTNPYQVPENQTFTYCVWHDSLLIPVFLGRQPATIAIVGQHRDGDYVSAILKAQGIDCVRGSSSKGGIQAIRQILEKGQDHHFVVTPDGPRGPRREMKSGVIFLAGKANKPIVPTAFTCRSYWSFGTGWTDLIVPKPFSTIHVVAGQPIQIPGTLRRAELDEHTTAVQTEMDRINDLAVRLASGEHCENELAQIQGQIS